MLDKEFQYYKDHQEELLKIYNGKFIVIVGDQVVGSYADRREAYFHSIEQGHTLGTFLIQKCSPGPESYTVCMNTQAVVFS